MKPRKKKHGYDPPSPAGAFVRWNRRRLRFVGKDIPSAENKEADGQGYVSDSRKSRRGDWLMEKGDPHPRPQGFLGR